MNGGAFHGREPDERRTDLDLGRLDSYAVQVAWARGRWSGQVSSAWLTRPERLSTYDAERRTASVAYEWRDGDRSLAWTAAAGQNREVHGNLEAYLVEATWRWSARYAVYMRAEQVAKDILDAGFHPVGVGHRHRQSTVGALTAGAVRDVVSGRARTVRRRRRPHRLPRAAEPARGLRAAALGARVPASARPRRHGRHDRPRAPALTRAARANDAGRAG